MVMLRSPRSSGPLLTRLAASPRPALRQEPGATEAAPGAVDVRIELSGAVVANWAAKASGLLAQEGVGPGDEVVVDLPPHWLAHALVLGALTAGARPVFPGDDDAAASAVLTDDPGRWPDPALTLFSVTLPRGLEPEVAAASDPALVDVAAEIRAQPDALPGEVGHVRADMLGTADEHAAPVAGRDRLTRADAAAALHAWDRGDVHVVRR